MITREDLETVLDFAKAGVREWGAIPKHEAAIDRVRAEFNPEECSTSFNQLTGRSEYHWFPPPVEAGRQCQCGRRVMRANRDGFLASEPVP